MLTPKLSAAGMRPGRRMFVVEQWRDRFEERASGRQGAGYSRAMAERGGGGRWSRAGARVAPAATGATRQDHHGGGPERGVAVRRSDPSLSFGIAHTAARTQARHRRVACRTGDAAAPAFAGSPAEHPGSRRRVSARVGLEVRRQLPEPSRAASRSSTISAVISSGGGSRSGVVERGDLEPEDVEVDLVAGDEVGVGE
jgi:hypothetical protein